MDLMSGNDEDSGETSEESVAVASRLLWFLAAGFILVFVGVAVIFVAAVLSGGGSVSGGVVIFIGPFPIVIGAGPDVTWIVLFSIIMAVLSVVVFLVMRRKVRELEI
jgi:uncharacterized membrane protein